MTAVMMTMTAVIIMMIQWFLKAVLGLSPFYGGLRVSGLRGIGTRFRA